MKLRTITIATAFALSSTFALAQTGGGSATDSAGASSGTTTGPNTSGAANSQGTGANTVQSDKMTTGTGTPDSSASGSTGHPNKQDVPDGKNR
jgi:uncharacterized protein YdeI (BOF family)